MKLHDQLRRLIDAMHEAECICQDIEDDHGIRIAPWDKTFAVIAGTERLRAHFAATYPKSITHWVQTELRDGKHVVDDYTATSVGTFVAQGDFDRDGRLRFREAYELTQEERDAIADDDAVLG
ncbi:MAG TPA: hypothetical protein PLD73_01360 [Candidatus Hydrogenedentes bacterium]|nr:hypothetical protein [Candidatus Hydrogenedentota bacterium]